MILPKDFIHEIDSLSIDTQALCDSIFTPPKTTIRRHRHKSDPAHYSSLIQVDWCPLAYYLVERPKFTEEPSFLSGEYYVQEASSMFLHHVLRQISLLDQIEDPLILDACAAPGGKSTILLDYLDGRGTLVANEVIRSRAKVLSENIIKWGYSNTIITNSNLSRFSKDTQFDMILVDAPCSGEGLFRKDPKAIDHWSREHVNHCSARQKRILEDAVKLLRPGGYLIYSTCTYNMKENEEQVNRLLQQSSFSIVDIKCPSNWSIHTTNAGFRFFPHLIDGEGLFMTVLQKEAETFVDSPTRYNDTNTLIDKKEHACLSEWLRQSEIQHFRRYQNTIVHYTGKVDYQIFKGQRIYSFGRQIGKLIKDDLRPHPHYAYSNYIAKNIATKELSKDAMLSVVNRKILPSTSETGWTLLTYRGNGLFWAKSIKHKYKVQYPKY